MVKSTLSRLAILAVVTMAPAITGSAGPATRTDWNTFGAPGNGINQFAGPTSIFVNPAGKIFVTDARNSRLVRVNDMSGTGWTTFGTHGTGINQFSFPFRVFVNAYGQVFVTDIYRIVRINDMTGAGWTTFGTRGRGVNQFIGLTGIFVSPAGQIFVADTGNDRIVRVNDMAGSGWTTFGTSGNGVNQLSRPVGVFVNAAGQIFVADAGNHRLVRIDDMAGTGWITFDTYTVRGTDHSYWSPTGISVSPAGQISMTDLGNQRIVRINDMAGTGRTTFNTVGLCTHTWSPGIFVNAKGEIFVADYAGDRIMHTSHPRAEPEPQPDRRPANCTFPPTTPGPQRGRPIGEGDPLLDQDEAKGVYQEPLGDFFVGPHQTRAWPPCPEPHRPAKNYKASELYSPVFGELDGLWECANGGMLLIESSIREPNGYVILIAKAYFVGPAKLPFEASLDRLVLLTVAGKPAIVRLSPPGLFWSVDLVVIERFPTSDQPGIMVFVEESDRSLEETVALAAQIMGR